MKRLTYSVSLLALISLLAVLAWFLSVIAIIVVAFRLKDARKYAVNQLIAWDQLANTIFGGDPDNTISSRCWLNRDKPGWRQLRFVLDWIDPNHCQKSFEKDEGEDAI